MGKGKGKDIWVRIRILDTRVIPLAWSSLLGGNGKDMTKRVYGKGKEKGIWVRVRILDTRVRNRDILSCGSSLLCGNPPASPLPDKLHSSEGYVRYLYRIYVIYRYM